VCVRERVEFVKKKNNTRKGIIKKKILRIGFIGVDDKSIP